MKERVRVACVQAEPAILDRVRTLDKLAALTAEAKAGGAELVVFPETFVPAYPSSAWAKFLAGWADPKAKAAFAQLSRESMDVPGPDCDRLGEIAREHEVWLVTGVNERDPERPGTLYNALLYHGPDGTLALHHRKLVPTNHERMIWGQGDGGGLRALPTSLGRIGGLICWENYMPLARFSLYESGVEIYIASTADDGDAWQSTLVHIARESRAFVVSPSPLPARVVVPRGLPAPRGDRRASTSLGRGGSAILAPDGSYLAGPLYDEEGILYADLDPERLYEERQRFDAAATTTARTCSSYTSGLTRQEIKREQVLLPRPRLPAVPVDHRVQRSPHRRLEVRADRVGDRDQRRLHHLVVGDPEQFRRLLLVRKVERRPDGAEPARPSGEHEAPRRGHDRAPA